MLHTHKRTAGPRAFFSKWISRVGNVVLSVYVFGMVPALADTRTDPPTREAVYRSAATAYRQVLLAEKAEASTATEAPAGTKTSQEHLKLSKQLYDEGKTFEALTHANYALTLDPGGEQTREWSESLRRAFEEETRKKAKAKAYIDKALEAEKDGKTRRAVKYWKKAHRLLPEDEDIAEKYEAIERTGSSYTGVKAKEVEPEALSDTPQQISDYLVTRGDVLEVFVWQHKDVSRNVIVRPDGRISIPLVGDIPAAGQTLTQLDANITEQLRTYIRFPDVSLAIKRFGGTKTIVLGEVRRPGVYVPEGEGSLVELLAMAGGFTSKAYGSDVLVIRGGLERPQVTKLDLASVFDNGSVGENIVLQPNDIVYVPKQRVDSIVDFVAKLTPILANTLLGQNVATNFGVYETSGAAAQ